MNLLIIQNDRKYGTVLFSTICLECSSANAIFLKPHISELVPVDSPVTQCRVFARLTEKKTTVDLVEQKRARDRIRWVLQFFVFLDISTFSSSCHFYKTATVKSTAINPTLTYLEQLN